MPLPDPLSSLGALAGIATVLAATYGFYTGVLPRWLRRMIGYYELQESIEEVRANTENLKRDHEETIDEIETLKHGQLAIAHAVDDEHDSIDVEALHEEHYVDRDRPDDYLRGSGHVPDGGRREDE